MKRNARVSKRCDIWGQLVWRTLQPSLPHSLPAVRRLASVEHQLAAQREPHLQPAETLANEKLPRRALCHSAKLPGIHSSGTNRNRTRRRASSLSPDALSTNNPYPSSSTTTTPALLRAPSSSSSSSPPTTAAMASRIATRAFSTTVRRLQQQAQQSEHVLKAESKRNPELMVRPVPPPRRRRHVSR